MDWSLNGKLGWSPGSARQDGQTRAAFQWACGPLSIVVALPLVGGLRRRR